MVAAKRKLKVRPRIGRAGWKSVIRFALWVTPPELQMA
jgi:hypothetical protein